MPVALVELFLGIYFIGVSVAIVKTTPGYNKTVDVFKLILGVALVALALIQGVRFI